jgi:hypothetical protein
MIGASWGRKQHAELRRIVNLAKEADSNLGKARAITTQLVSGDTSFPFYTLKQFRDADQPDRACFQALVSLDRRLHNITDVREIEERLFVQIYDWPSQPIVQELGLVVKNQVTINGIQVHQLEPMRPFWVTGSITEELGVQHAVRAGGTKWIYPPDLRHRKAPPQVPVAIDEQVTHGSPQRLTDKLAMLREDPTMASLCPTEAHQVIQQIKDPKVIIDSALSREWEHWGNPRWWSGFERYKKELEEAKRSKEIKLENWIAYVSDKVASNHIHRSFRGAEVEHLRKLGEQLTMQVTGKPEDTLSNDTEHNFCMRLAKLSQKPDFCVFRLGLEGGAREKWFRRTQSWDDEWYVGPDPDAKTSAADSPVPDTSSAYQATSPPAASAAGPSTAGP